MIVLTKEEMKKVFTMKDAITSSKKALQLYSQGKALVPLRMNLPIPKEDGLFLFMPAYIDDLDMSGMKMVSIFPENLKRGMPSITGQMFLMDGKMGGVVAMLNGSYLTQLRTGAVQGLATDLLARKDAKIAALFGTGAQAQAQLEAMLTVRQLEEVRVVGSSIKKAQVFVESMHQEFQQYNANIVAVADAGSAVKEADIITTITTSKTPVFNAEYIKKGAHINGIGSYTPEMQELPGEIIQSANKLFFDTTEGVLSEAGDILIPLKSGMVTESHFTGDLGDLILGKVKGRETDRDITVFKSVGVAVLDLVTAYDIYHRALTQNVGQQISI